MRFTDPPDLGRPRWRLWCAALAVTLIVGLVTGFRDARWLSHELGDTDDAMRMVMVRALLHGQGWWDQKVVRLQPPVGVYMHWSRLLDGGIAALDRLFALVTDGPRAEWLTRLTWPILWVFPAVLSALAITDRLGERSDTRGAPGAVLICAFLLATNVVLYIQFHPGRVDHHDVQMACCFLALAGAVQQGPQFKGAILAGAATGLGLAVGLEALIFEAVIGGAIALRFVFDDRGARPLTAYGLSLALVTLAAFCVQTPPWRWSVSACDALAFNSAAAIVAAGLAVAAVCRLTLGRSAVVRFAALAAAAFLVGAIYIGFDPHCLQGPFADVDPAIKSFWLSHVQEMRPWLVVLKQKPQDAIDLATGPVMATAAVLWLGRRRETRQDSAFRLTTAVLVLTMIAGFNGVRLCGYADWIAMPLIAAAAADLADRITRRHRRESLIMVIIVGLLASPVSAAAGVGALNKRLSQWTQRAGGKKTPPPPVNHCFETAPYKTLAAAGPPGVVLSEIDLGPFILANTADSALAAPYHRMSWGMLKARAALSADADNGQAQSQARALSVRYVLECSAHRGHADRTGMAPNSLQKRLDQGGAPPKWLERVNAPKAVLEVFRVLPDAAPPR